MPLVRIVVFVHPVFQFALLCLAVYVLYLGSFRFRMVHMGQKARFNWKRHVLAGKIALGGLVLGALFGLGFGRYMWGGFLVSGLHGHIGLLIVLLALFGMSSGIYMDRVKKKRKVLPLMHAGCNCLVVLLGIIQIITGIDVLRNFVF